MLQFSILSIMILIAVVSSAPLIYGQQDGITEIQHCSNNSILNKFLDSKTNKTIVIVGKDAALSDIEAAEVIKNQMSSIIGKNNIEIRTDDSISDFEKHTANLISIGGPLANTVSAEVNEELSVKFLIGPPIPDPDITEQLLPTYDIVNSKTGVRYGQLDSRNFGLGFVNLVNDHYVKDYSVIVAAGVGAEGTMAAIKYLVNFPTCYSPINGNLAIVEELEDKTIMVRDPHLEIDKERIILIVDKPIVTNSTLIISNGGKIPYDLDIIPSDPNIIVVDRIQNMTQGEIKNIEVGYEGKIDKSIYKKDFEIHLKSTIGLDKKIPVIFQDSFEILQIQKNLNINSFNVTDNYIVTTELANQSNKTAIYEFFESVHPWMELESNTASCQHIPNERSIFCNGEIKPNSIEIIEYKGKISPISVPGNWKIKKTDVDYTFQNEQKFTATSNELILKIYGEPEIFSRLFIEPQSMKGGTTSDVTLVVTNNGIKEAYVEVKIDIPEIIDAGVLSSQNVEQTDDQIIWNTELLAPKESKELNIKIESKEEFFGFEPKQSKIQWQVQPSILEYKGTGAIIEGKGFGTYSKEFFIEPTFVLTYETIASIVIPFIISDVIIYYIGKRQGRKQKLENIKDPP